MYYMKYVIPTSLGPRLQFLMSLYDMLAEASETQLPLALCGLGGIKTVVAERSLPIALARCIRLFSG